MVFTLKNQLVIRGQTQETFSDSKYVMLNMTNYGPVNLLSRSISKNFNHYLLTLRSDTELKETLS